MCLCVCECFNMNILIIFVLRFYESKCACWLVLLMSSRFHCRSISKWLLLMQKMIISFYLFVIKSSSFIKLFCYTGYVSDSLKRTTSQESFVRESVYTSCTFLSTVHKDNSIERCVIHGTLSFYCIACYIDTANYIHNS